jgi:hypothetical protein
MKLIEGVSDYVKLKKLKRLKKRFERENRLKLDEYEYFGLHHDDSTPPEYAMTVNDYFIDIRTIETQKLRDLAEKWNIELNKNWLDMYYNKKGEQLHLLTDEAVTIRSYAAIIKGSNRVD